MLKIVLFILLFSATIALADDYLIVENPAALHLLDAYEQQLSQEEKNQLPRNMPFRILEENYILSDTYTRAIKTRNQGKTYFLVKDNQGKISIQYPENLPIRIRSARVLTDTIQIKQNERVVFQNEADQTTLIANELLQLIFQKNNRYYAKRLTPQGVFGWLNVNQSKYWQHFTGAHPIASDKMEFPVYLVNSVQAQFEEYNRILQQLFSFFNQTSEPQKATPRWVLVIEGNRIICQLENKPEETNFEHTTLKIIDRIKKIMPKGQGQITRVANRIIIYYGKDKTI
jgi:hypothetical protein